MPKQKLVSGCPGLVAVFRPPQHHHREASMSTISTKAKRAAVIKAFGKINVDDPDYVNWLYARRNLARAIDPNGGHRRLKYEIETDEVDSAIDDTMEKILKRDGRKSYEDASNDLLSQYTTLIVHLDGGPKRLLGMLHRIEAHFSSNGADNPSAAAH
jgi:hypothetical protein